MTCKGNSSNELTFGIQGSEGVISDAINTYTRFDLSSISESLLEWKSESRIIEPYSFVYFKGFDYGWAYQRNAYVKIPDEIVNDPDFEFISGIDFDVYQYKNGVAHKCEVRAKGSIADNLSFITDAQNILDDNEFALNIEVEGNLVILTSTVVGREFYISTECKNNTVRLYQDSSVLDSSTGETLEVYLYDYPIAHVPNKKYRNGAFKGVILKPIYPQYNDSAITDEMRSLKLGFLPDRMEVDKPICVNGHVLYDKLIFDVDDSFNDINEKMRYDKVCSTDYIDPIEYESEWDNQNTLIGLYGYVALAIKRKNLINVGALFVCLENTDTPDSANKNLLPSFILYNPNSYPVQVQSLLYC
jgi:hypothetical protein